MSECIDLFYTNVIDNLLYLRLDETNFYNILVYCNIEINSNPPSIEQEN